MTKYKIKENFRWMAAPEFEIVDTGKNTVTIKGVAVKKGQVSRNKRKYAGEELHAMARTFNGKPVTINHAPYDKNHPMYDGRKVAGHIEWMEYEDDRMEYRAKINKQPYVDLIRNKSVEIRGVSIEADYLFNRCGQCGEWFSKLEDFENHMINEHFIKNFNYEPRGAVGKALSLVLSPEEPGVPDTSIELMETIQEAVGFSQLLETIVSVHKRQEKTMPKKKPKTTEIPYKTKNIVEQEEDHGCKEDEHWDGENCVKNEQATEQETPSPPCPEGWHEEDGKCIKDETVAEQEISLEAPIAADITTEVPAVVAPEEMPVQEPESLPPPPLDCGDGFHEENGACVPDEEVTAQEPEPEQPPATTEKYAQTAEIKTLETKLPPKKKLAEPCSPELKSCVDQLIAKGTPEDSAWAICRSKVGETKTKLSENIYDTQKDLSEEMQILRNAAFARDNKIVDDVNNLKETVASIITYVRSLPQPINAGFKQLNENFQKAREQAKHQFLELGKADDKLKEFADKKLGQLATTQAKTDSAVKLQNQRLTEAYKHIKINRAATQQLAKRDIQIAENMKATTKDFEKILSVADKNALQDKNQIKTLEQRMQEMEKQDKEKSVTETTKLIERFDNLEHMLKKGNFKASSPPLESSTSNGKDRLGEKTPYEK